VSRYPLSGPVFLDNSLLVECNDLVVQTQRKSCYAGFESWYGRKCVAMVHLLFLEREARRESLVKAARQTLATASGTTCGERAAGW